jgi:hypothetical protein
MELDYPPLAFPELNRRSLRIAAGCLSQARDAQPVQAQTEMATSLRRLDNDGGSGGAKHIGKATRSRALCRLFGFGGVVSVIPDDASNPNRMVAPCWQLDPRVLARRQNDGAIERYSPLSRALAGSDERGEVDRCEHTGVQCGEKVASREGSGRF